MSAAASTPWGKQKLAERPARFSDQSLPVRRCSPPPADGAAPGEGGPPPTSSSGAGHCVVSFVFADSVALLARLVAAHHAASEDELVARLVVAEAERIGIARLADAGGASRLMQGGPCSQGGGGDAAVPARRAQAPP